MRYHVDIETDGPVTASAVRDNLQQAIDRQLKNAGLSADDDEGSVTGFTVTIADSTDKTAGSAGPSVRPIRIRCTKVVSGPADAVTIRNVSYVTKDARRGWSCTLSNGVAAGLSYAGILGDEVAATYELDDADGVKGVLAVLRRLGGRPWTYEAV